MTLKILIEKCLIVIYFLAAIGSIAALIAIVKDAITQFEEDYTVRFNKKKELSTTRKVKGFLGLLIFFIPFLHLLILYYLLTRTDDVYELVYEVLEELYE